MGKELDCRNLQCPEPVIRCRALLGAEHPAELDVLVDNQAALENVIRFLKSNGYAISRQQLAGNEWRIDARSTGEAPVTTTPASNEGQSTLILITSETLGRGDEELGAKLMANFLGSLSELGANLWRIILLNGGVKLAAREGAALDNLRKLAESGVSILVCGTCLMHYGLLEQKLIGETTNMMDVVTSLALAQKVIRP